MRTAAELAYRRSPTYVRAKRRETWSRVYPLMMAVAGFAAGVIIALH